MTPSEHEIIRLLQERTAVLENLEEALTLVDPAGKVIFRNRASLTLHGYDSTEDAKFPKAIYYENWRVYDLDGQPVPLEDWPLRRALRGETFSGYELSIQSLDRGISYIGSYAGRLIHDDQGKPLFAMLTIRDITEQKRMERELRNERELLQTIYDRIPVMLSIYDPKLEKIHLNKHVERVTGWTPKDTQKTSIMELTYPDPAYRKYVADYMQSLKPGFQDLFMVTREGKVIESSWANVEIPDGRQVGIGINLTERVRAEKALKVYSARLKFLHEVDEAILIAQSEKEVAEAVVTRIPEWLPECVQACVTVPDYEQKQIQLLANSDGLVEEESDTWEMGEPSFWSPIREDLASGKACLLENLDQIPADSPFRQYGLRKSVKVCAIHPIVINDRMVATLNLGKRTAGAFSAEQNEIIKELLTPLTIGIEQARLHQHALQKSRRLLETIINNIPVGIALIRGSDLKILYANPAYYDISPTSNLIGKTLNDVWRVEQHDYLRLCRQVLDQGVPFFMEDDETKLYRDHNGTAETAYFSWWLFPIEIPDEPETGILNMAYETTNRKLAERALVEAERLTTIGRMAASLAHEINNPIQSVVGCLGLAEELIDSGEDASRFMDVAMEELIRASKIVQRLRDLTRTDDPIQKEAVDIPELLEKVITLTHKQALDRDVEVCFERGKDCPPVRISPDQIRQVFLNLILNAIEAMPNGGMLRIATEETRGPSGMNIIFADNGVGVKEEDLDLLFDAFHSTKQLGLGLGLYVSRRIINLHGGRIAVKSRPDQGSTFTIWLPSSH